MNGQTIIALLPLIVTAAAATVTLVTIAVRRSYNLVFMLTLVGLSAAGASVALAGREAPCRVTALLLVDAWALFYTWLVIAAAFITAVLSYDYLERCVDRREEFYVLILLATAGSIVLVSSSHFVSFFLGLEILSVSLYALIGYRSDHAEGTEAAVKYLILGGASSAFLLFGMALIYADLGTMASGTIARLVAAGEYGILTTAGLGLLLVSIGFKMALVPFHLWIADVYQGAPAPAAAFIASVSKGAVAALLVRYFMPIGVGHGILWYLLVVLAIASMFTGNLLALFQTNVKRILAYSSIAHMGYLLVAFLAGGQLGGAAVTYYLAAYFVTIIGAFGVVSMLSGPDRDADLLSDYAGLAAARPWLAGIFTLMLLSLAGIPLTAGFIGKFFVLYAGLGSHLRALSIILVVNSAIGLFYYLRIVVTLYASAPEGATPVPERLAPTAVLGATALSILVLLLFFLGVWPGPLTAMVQAVGASLFH
jgi:NADH-quinone oxidoreductase subunit N